jgi:SAM-dependent methyltransferase
MDWRKYWNTSQFLTDPDPCRQVGRTFRGHSYTPAQITAIVQRIGGLLRADRSKRLLDLACGNGMLTSRLSPFFKSITAVDFSAPLIASARRDFARDNVEYLVADVLDVPERTASYDCVLVYFAFQYFSPAQAVTLFRQIDSLLGPSGVVLLGEVADADRRWNFYRGPQGWWRFVYDLARRRPIIGHWWRPVDLLPYAEKHGLKLAIHYHDRLSPNHYFRYDAVLSRSGNAEGTDGLQVLMQESRADR